MLQIRKIITNFAATRIRHALPPEVITCEVEQNIRRKFNLNQRYKMKDWFRLFLTALLLIPAAVHAQWTTDYGKNTQVTPNGLGYDENEVITNSDGVTYAFFIVPSNGTLDMRLQVLDKEGNKLMERGGHSISREANKVWSSYNQHLALDNKGDAFVGVQDFRTAPDAYLSSYTIYKYSADGKQLWDGTTLNGGQGFATELGLSICGLDDGGCVCAYVYRNETDGNDCVAMERLDADGKSVWNKTVIKNPVVQGVYPYPFLAKGKDGNIIMVYIADGTMLKTHVTDADGNAVNADDATVYTGGLASSKPWEVLKVTPDADGGALITLMSSAYNSVFTYVNSDGTSAFADRPEGVVLNDTRFGGSQPSVVYSKSNGCFVCAYQQFDPNNSDNQGLYMRRVNSDGTPGDNATTVADMQTEYMYSFYSVQDAGNGNTALFFQKCDEPAQIVDSYMNVYGADGTQVGETTKFTETLTMKQNLKSSAMIDGKYFIASWDEDRYTTTSLFMQKVELPEAAGITAPTTSTETVKSEIFTADGVKTSKTVKGLNIIKMTHSDGSVTTKKVVMN